jgi:hypothetical protein
MGWPRCTIGAAVWLGLALAAGCGRSPVVLWGLDGGGDDGGDDGAPPNLRCGDSLDDVFAQVVVEYDPTAGGGREPLRQDVIDPDAALGPPDHMPEPPLGTVSIGDGGTLAVGFEPCVMGTDLTRGFDLFVHEAGFDEQVTVELRPTAEARVVLGSLVDADGYVRLAQRPESSGGVDVDEALAGIAPEGLRFDAVRIRDVSGQGLETVETPGADIDAVEIVVAVPSE